MTGETPLVGVADRAAVHDLGQFVEPATVFQRDAEQFRDHVRRERACDVVDEVALAPLRDVVDDLARHVGDVIVQLGDLAGREALADQRAELRVARRVHRQHHQLELELVLGAWNVEEHACGLRRPGGAVARDGEDFVVSGESQESGSVAVRVPGDRRTAPKLAKGVERHAEGVGIRIGEVDSADGDGILSHARQCD